MLDIMRRRKGATRIVLSLVVVGVAGSFAAALYGIWGGALSQGQQGAPDWIAIVDGERIGTREFSLRRDVIHRDLQERIGNQGVDSETLARIVDQQALGATLGIYLARKEAERSGLRVTGAEISDLIVNLPFLQLNGRFVGVEGYRRWLRAQGRDTYEFESELSHEIAADKLRLAVAGLAQLDEAAVDKRYRDEVERVDVDYVLLADSVYADSKAPTESELRAWFGSHASQYLTPEARRAAYVLFDREAKAASVPATDAEIEDYYAKNKDTLYAHPEQRRASHILVRTNPGATPEEDAAARDKAAAALARIRGGEDFAAVARAVSEDPGSAAAGGDLGYFGRGRMVKEFEDAAFGLAIGSVSDLVKSPFGYHILKATDRRDAGVQALAEVRDEIRRTLGVQRAQEEIRKEADAFVARLASQESSFEKSAADAALTPGETGFFAKGEPAGPLGRLPQVDDAVFALSPGAHSPIVVVPQGVAVFSLLEIRAPRPAPFEDVRAKVESDLKTSRSREKARRVADELLSASGDLKTRAERKKLELKSYPSVNRIQPLPPLTDASKSAAFAARIGSILGPFESEEGLLVLEVKQRTPATPEEATARRAELRRQMLDEERTLLYQALMSRIQNASKITINEGLLRLGRGNG